MITIPSGTRVLLATRPVDFRKGAHSLAALAAEMLGGGPVRGRGGGVAGQAGRSGQDPGVGRERAGAGVESNCSRVPSAGRRWWDGALRLSAVEFAALFDGLDWTRVQNVRRIPTPTVAA